MRRVIAVLALLAAFVIPFVTSCVPGGYEGKNPARSDIHQVPPEMLQSDQTGEQPAGGDTQQETQGEGQ